MLAVTICSLVSSSSWTLSVIRVFDIRRVPATRDIPRFSYIPSRQKPACVRCIRTSNERRNALCRAVPCRVAISWRKQDARADRPIMRELFELSAGRRSAVRVERAVSVVSAVNAASGPSLRVGGVDSVSGKVPLRGVRFEKALCRSRSG